jgi:hypothetical protein
MKVIEHQSKKSGQGSGDELGVKMVGHAGHQSRKPGQGSGDEKLVDRSVCNHPRPM